MNAQVGVPGKITTESAADGTRTYRWRTKDKRRHYDGEAHSHTTTRTISGESHVCIRNNFQWLQGMVKDGSGNVAKFTGQVCGCENDETKTIDLMLTDFTSGLVYSFKDATIIANREMCRLRFADEGRSLHFESLQVFSGNSADVMAQRHYGSAGPKSENMLVFCGRSELALTEPSAPMGGSRNGNIFN